MPDPFYHSLTVRQNNYNSMWGREINDDEMMRVIILWTLRIMFHDIVCSKDCCCWQEDQRAEKKREDIDQSQVASFFFLRSQFSPANSHSLAELFRDYSVRDQMFVKDKDLLLIIRRISSFPQQRRVTSRKNSNFHFNFEGISFYIVIPQEHWMYHGLEFSSCQ